MSAIPTDVDQVRHRRVPSPLGELVLVGTDEEVVALHLPTGRTPSPGVLGPVDPDLLPDVVTQLDDYFAGGRTTFEVALAPRGTDFQQRVWGQLVRIPHGETRTYGQVAEHVGGITATRAVGLANGANPIAIIVPCHRVIGADGALVGYAGGLQAKRFLLDLEAGAQRLFLSP